MCVQKAVTIFPTATMYGMQDYGPPPPEMQYFPFKREHEVRQDFCGVVFSDVYTQVNSMRPTTTTTRSLFIFYIQCIFFFSIPISHPKCTYYVSVFVFVLCLCISRRVCVVSSLIITSLAAVCVQAGAS